MLAALQGGGVEKAMAAAKAPKIIGRQLGLSANAMNCHKEKATKPVRTASVLRSIADKTMAWAQHKVPVDLNKRKSV